MDNFSIEQVRANKVRDFYIIHKTGYPLFHRAYMNSKIEPSLITGFLTAVFNFSKRVSNTEIQTMDMGDFTSIYETSENYIFLINMYKDTDESIGDKILTQIIGDFEQFLSKTDKSIIENDLFLADELKKKGFEKVVDAAVNAELLSASFKSPVVILSEIETFLTDLFGSMGSQVLNNSIERVAKKRENFNVDQLNDLIVEMKQMLEKKMDKNQAHSIIQQIADTYLPN